MGFPGASAMQEGWPLVKPSGKLTHTRKAAETRGKKIKYRVELVLVLLK